MSTINLSKLRKVGGEGSSDISITGPTSVTAGTANVYTITDYDDFSVYSVNVVGGTSSRSGATITVNVGVGATGILEMTVSRNESVRVFQIAVGTSAVSTPFIVYPASSGANIPNSFVLQGSNFSTVPTGASTHKSRRFQIARDAGFTDIFLNTVVSTGNKTQYPVVGLSSGMQYFARIQDTAENGIVSAFSNTVSFTVSSQTIQTPTVTSPAGTVELGATPFFTATSFVASPAGSDTHVSSSWVVRNASTDVVVWQSNNNSTNKTSITVPQGFLTTSTSYTVQVQFNGGFGSSMFSEKLTFSTASSFIPSTPGVPFGGGYYVGKINADDGKQYALIVSPASLGGESSTTLRFKTTSASTTTSSSLNNGWSNMQSVIAAGIASFPASEFCRNLSIGGYTDWYLPSADELEMLYRAFKPGSGTNGGSDGPYDENSGYNPSSVPQGVSYTQTNPGVTNVSLFLTGGAEALRLADYVSSSVWGNLYVWTQDFTNGSQNSYTLTRIGRVRAVRRVLIS